MLPIHAKTLRRVFGPALAMALLAAATTAVRAQSESETNPLDLFNQATSAVGGTISFDEEMGETGSLRDGSQIRVPFTFDRVTFSNGQFTVPATYTLTSATQDGNVVTFTGTHSTDNGAAPYMCSVDIVTGAFSGSCQGFLGLSGAATAQQAIAASSVGILRNEARAVSMLLSGRLRDISRDLARGQAVGATTGQGGRSGLAAGTAPARYGVWADVSGSYIKNDAPGKAYQGTGVTALSGIDAIIGDSWVVGFSAGYTRADLTLAGIGGSRLSRGAVAGPYASYVINEHFTVDGNVNYTRLTNDVDAGPAPILHSRFNSDRFSGGIEGNYFTDLGPLSLTAFTGYTYAYERAKGYADPSGTPFPANVSRYGAIKLGGEISYAIGPFEPYLPLTYEYQTTAPQDGTGRSALLVGVGLRYHFGDTVTAGLLATTEQLRAHEETATLAGNLRIAF